MKTEMKNGKKRKERKKQNGERQNIEYAWWIKM